MRCIDSVQGSSAPADAISLSANGLGLRSGLLRGSSEDGDTDAAIRLSFDQPAGRGEIGFYEFDPDFNIIVSDCFWRQDGFVKYAGEGWIRFNFCLDAKAAFDFEELGRFELRGQELRVFHQPEGMDCGHHIFGNGRSVCVTISVRRAYLGKLLGTRDNRFLESAEQTGGDGFFFQRYEMDPASLRAVADMLTMKHRGTLRLLYAKAKSEELLVNALSFAGHGEGASPRIRLGERDRTRILQVREMLDETFAKPPPVSELARRFGINRNKLSYGFRAVHDRSMSEYIADRRLETAWQLLDETDRPVAHIAEEVGFSHLQSFSSAFKKRYGLSPSMLRRSASDEK
ncbi:helix-turn-helix domain-containing protein [Hoeflea alexandrii]|uniref:Helix-turn-helix domain-containing protein n=1 Tax=Hoeflea alexandrii TaxID=288436 RepID=A0ABT1CRQ3_9HYPH|nr:AraC family transcriptional regulator [Hoeflea alexandrii]MCO6408887.1 helix-turn-helix domain-containing protein [Hoeflea alexandrii]